VTRYHWHKLKPGQRRIVDSYVAVVAALNYARRARRASDSAAPIFRSRKLKTPGRTTRTGRWEIRREA
jgi:hypothetical protein